MTIHVFGLTGGIGSGKSTVAARFQERGLPVIDADRLAREAVAKGSAGLRAIVEAFGDGVLETSGELDRKKLAGLVFGDDGARARLNAITHPRVAELGLQRIAELEARGHPLVCYEVPLLVESGLADTLRPLVVVAIPEELQVARVMVRDQVTETEARARLQAQLPLSAKIAVADYVIDNSGSLAATQGKADDVLDAICTGLGVDACRYARGARTTVQS